jgi:hypothetical protein
MVSFDVGGLRCSLMVGRADIWSGSGLVILGYRCGQLGKPFVISCAVTMMESGLNHLVYNHRKKPSIGSSSSDR